MISEKVLIEENINSMYMIFDNDTVIFNVLVGKQVFFMAKLLTHLTTKNFKNMVMILIILGNVLSIKDELPMNMMILKT